MIDPIQFEVFRNALLEATEEMSITLRRSAYSTNIKTRADFSCAFFDRQLRPVAQASGQPVHLGSLAVFVPRIIQEYGQERIGPGDGILANDPYLGGVHLNDVTLVSSVYHQDELVGYVANLAHHVDVGGGSPGSIGAFREIYQEGIIIPPVKLVESGKIVPDIFKFVLAQIRSRHETAGDFRAQIGANLSGGHRIAAMVKQSGIDAFSNYVDELLNYTERRTRTELSKLPTGRFAAEGVVDNDGFTEQPVKLAAAVTIDTDGIVFDFSGSDAQRRAPVNSTYSMTFAACAYVLKALVDPDVPVNAGFYRAVKMIAPSGTVVNCIHPAPVVGGWETQTRLTDVILKALFEAIPNYMPAGTKAMMAQVAFGGTDPKSGELFAFYEAVAGGYGGRFSKDGADAVQAHGQNTENAPIEEIESNYPVRIQRYELIEDSEGPGRQRGGLGLRRDYTLLGTAASFTILSDRDRWGPWGLLGGLPGQKASYILNPEGDAHTLASKTTIELKPEDVVSFRTCGGGGYGNPAERDPFLVLQDVREGKVNIHRAREIYRVSINESDWTIDERQTNELRRKNNEEK